MTAKQIENYNRMREELIQITKYQTTNQLRKEGDDRKYGLDYEETLEYAYENVMGTAKDAVKGIKAIKS